MMKMIMMNLRIFILRFVLYQISINELMIIMIGRILNSKISIMAEIYSSDSSSIISISRSFGE